MRSSSLSQRERAGGESRCAPCDCVGRAAQFNGPAFPATASAEGAQFNVPPSLRPRSGAGGALRPSKRPGDPHPSPLPEGEGTGEHTRKGRVVLTKNCCSCTTSEEYQACNTT